MITWISETASTPPRRRHALRDPRRDRAATAVGEDIVHGHGVRGGKAMIATLRWRLIAVPGRLVRHARHLTLRLPPGHYLLPEVLARLRELPVPA